MVTALGNPIVTLICLVAAAKHARSPLALTEFPISNHGTLRDRYSREVCLQTKVGLCTGVVVRFMTSVEVHCAITAYLKRYRPTFLKFACSKHTALSKVLCGTAALPCTMVPISSIRNDHLQRRGSICLCQ